MKEWWRRVRGALGMGLTWAVGWAPVGAVLGVVAALMRDVPADRLPAFVLNVVVLGTLGFLGGTLFSTALRLTEGRRRFDELTVPRFAALGAIGGLLLGGVAGASGLYGAGLVPQVAVTVVVTLLGAGSAAGSLALARRADPALLKDSAEVNEVGLSEQEARQLLS